MSKYTPTMGGSCVRGHICRLGIPSTLTSLLTSAQTTPSCRSVVGGDTITPLTCEEFTVPPQFVMMDWFKELMPPPPPALAGFILLLVAEDDIVLQPPPPPHRLGRRAACQVGLTSRKVFPTRSWHTGGGKVKTNLTTTTTTTLMGGLVIAVAADGEGTAPMGGIMVGLRGSNRLKGSAPPMIGSGSLITAGAAEYLFVGLSFFRVFGRATSNGMMSFSILGEERGFRSPEGRAHIKKLYQAYNLPKKKQICSYVDMSTDLKSVVFSSQNEKNSR
jgi:hypothetical protein